MHNAEVKPGCLWVCAAVVLALGAGCGRGLPVSGLGQDGNPHYLKAKKLYEQRDYAAAAESYKKALLLNPQLAAAHLELGLLYDDKLGDPIAAIYHYRRFLELRPDSEKRQLVEDFIERARLSLAAKLPQSPIVDPAELTRLQAEKAALLAENAALKARIAELQKATAAAAAGAAAAPVPVAAVAEAAPEPVRARTHVVQRGETLQSLALRYYGTRSAWERIYQANRHQLPSKDQLRVGQQLVIP